MYVWACEYECRNPQMPGASGALNKQEVLLTTKQPL